MVEHHEKLFNEEQEKFMARALGGNHQPMTRYASSIRRRAHRLH